MRTRTALTIAACLVVTGCGGGGQDNAAPTAEDGAGADGAAVVTIADFDFGEVPAVAVGATFTVENTDSAPHTFTADDGTFDTGTIGGGGTATVTVDAAGDYAVSCTIHPSMTATLTVTG